MVLCGLTRWFVGGHDAMYHVMWIIIYQTLRETGIRESNEIKRSGIGTHQMPEFAAAEERLQTEALNAASRIAGLVRLPCLPSIMRGHLYSAILRLTSSPKTTISASTPT